MHITARNLEKHQIHPNDRKYGDTFIELEKDPTNPENKLTYDTSTFPLPARIANGIAMILDWQNGENPNNNYSKLLEPYKQGFDRETLGDCHNFVWMATTGSIDIHLSSRMISSSFIMPEQMKMAGFREIATIHTLSPDDNTIIIEDIAGNKQTISPEDFESILLPGDNITLYHYDYHQYAHSFIFLGIDGDGLGRYLQRVGPGGHLSIVSLRKTMWYYPGMMGKKGMISSYSKIYRNLNDSSNIEYIAPTTGT